MASEKSEFERVVITNRNYRKTIGESSTITMQNRVFEDFLRQPLSCLQYVPRVVLMPVFKRKLSGHLLGKSHSYIRISNIINNVNEKTASRSIKTRNRFSPYKF